MIQNYLTQSGRQKIAGMEELAKTPVFNPNACLNNKSLGDMTGLMGFGFYIITVDPGCETTEHHVHHHEDECVYLLEGEATAVIGESEHLIGLGDFIGYREGGLAHSVRSTGKTTLRCIAVGERLARDVGDYPRLGKRIYRHAALPWNLDDLDRIAEPKAGEKK